MCNYSILIGGAVAFFFSLNFRLIFGNINSSAVLPALISPQPLTRASVYLTSRDGGQESRGKGTASSPGTESQLFLYHSLAI